MALNIAVWCNYWWYFDFLLTGTRILGSSERFKMQLWQNHRPTAAKSLHWRLMLKSGNISSFSIRYFCQALGSTRPKFWHFNPHAIRAISMICICFGQNSTDLTVAFRLTFEPELCEIIQFRTNWGYYYTRRGQLGVLKLDLKIANWIIWSRPRKMIYVTDSENTKKILSKKVQSVQSNCIIIWDILNVWIL